MLSTYGEGSCSYTDGSPANLSPRATFEVMVLNLSSPEVELRELLPLRLERLRFVETPSSDTSPLAGRFDGPGPTLDRLPTPPRKLRPTDELLEAERLCNFLGLGLTSSEFCFDLAGCGTFQACLLNEASARKQYFAGVQKPNKTGRMWAVSEARVNLEVGTC